MAAQRSAPVTTAAPLWGSGPRGRPEMVELAVAGPLQPGRGAAGGQAQNSPVGMLGIADLGVAGPPAHLHAGTGRVRCARLDPGGFVQHRSLLADVTFDG